MTRRTSSTEITTDVFRGFRRGITIKSKSQVLFFICQEIKIYALIASCALLSLLLFLLILWWFLFLRSSNFSSETSEIVSCAAFKILSVCFGLTRILRFFALTTYFVILRVILITCQDLRDESILYWPHEKVKVDRIRVKISHDWVSWEGGHSSGDEYLSSPATFSQDQMMMDWFSN